MDVYVLALALIGFAWVQKIQGPSPAVNFAAWVFALIITICILLKFVRVGFAFTGR